MEHAYSLVQGRWEPRQGHDAFWSFIDKYKKKWIGNQVSKPHKWTETVFKLFWKDFRVATISNFTLCSKKMRGPSQGSQNKCESFIRITTKAGKAAIDGTSVSQTRNQKKLAHMTATTKEQGDPCERLCFVIFQCDLYMRGYFPRYNECFPNSSVFCFEKRVLQSWLKNVGCVLCWRS